MPYATAFGADGNIAASEDANLLNENRGAVIAVVGNRGEAATKVSQNPLVLFPSLKLSNE